MSGRKRRPDDCENMASLPPGMKTELELKGDKHKAKRQELKADGEENWRKTQPLRREKTAGEQYDQDHENLSPFLSEIKTGPSEKPVRDHIKKRLQEQELGREEKKWQLQARKTEITEKKPKKQDQDHKKMVSVLTEKRTEMETKSDQFKAKLQELEADREANKRKKQSLEKEISEREPKKQDQDHKKMAILLEQVKNDLETHVKAKLQELEADREANKRKIQSLEKEISEIESKKQDQDHKKMAILLAQVKNDLETHVKAKLQELEADILNREREREREKEPKKQDQDHEKMVSLLMQMKTELETQRDQLKVNLQELEADREGNKKKLQSVEREITEREQIFDKPEGLLREKEKLLEAQWNFDQMKKIYEREVLNKDKVLELLEMMLLE